MLKKAWELLIISKTEDSREKFNPENVGQMTHAIVTLTLILNDIQGY